MTKAERKRMLRRRQLRIRFIKTMLGTFLFLGILAGAVKLRGVPQLLGNAGRTVTMLAAAQQKGGLSGYPDSLQELYEKNPEAREFVEHYEKEKERSGKIDISKDVSKGEIPFFLQWDERWGYRKYGSDYMAVNGCGPTCLSMVYSGLTGKTDYNPYKTAKMAEKKGYYVYGSGTSWDMMTRMAGEMGLIAREECFEEGTILRDLQDKVPMIAIVGPGDFTTQGHFIVLCGLDKDGKVIVHDPNSRKRSKKHWEIGVLMGQIRNIWRYYPG